MVYRGDALEGRNSAADRIASRIADDLFSNGWGEKADRLLLAQQFNPSSLGGWSKQAVHDLIVKQIMADEELRLLA